MKFKFEYNAPLERCPFCGGKAEIIVKEVEQSFPIKMSPLSKRKQNIYNWPLIRTEGEGENKKLVFLRTYYIPTCCDRNCMGRISRKFETEERAIYEWNRRSNNAE